MRFPNKRNEQTYNYMCTDARELLVMQSVIIMSNGSAVGVFTDGHTDRHTDGTFFITLTADTGGNNSSVTLQTNLIP